MDEQTFRQQVRAYRAELDRQNRVAHSFSWSARFLMPFAYNDGVMVREVCATIAARTWVEAGALIALYDLKQPPERQVTDVLVRKNDVVALAWDRKGRLYVLDSETLRRRDDLEEGLILPLTPR